MYLLKFILSLVYAFLVFLRNKAFDLEIIKPSKLPGFVISVGNIEVGGNHKTPTCIALAQHFITKNYTAIILTRGYKSGLKSTDYQILKAGQIIKASNELAATKIADEAKMMSLSLPDSYVVVGAKRFQSAQFFLSLRLLPLKQAKNQDFEQSLVWILDDGFQHRWLHRNLDLVIIDDKTLRAPSLELLPLGPFREHKKALERATTIFVKGKSTPDSKELAQLGIFCPLFHLETTSYIKFVIQNKKNLPLSALIPEKLGLVCGIAKPLEFAYNFRGSKSTLSTFFVGDHEHFDQEKLFAFSKNCDGIATTFKDYSRDESVFHRLNLPIFVYDIKIQLPNNFVV